MSLHHHAYLLDFNGFHNNISQIIKSLELGDAGPLFKNALEITQQKHDGIWIFSDIGDTLFDISKFDDSGRPYTSPVEMKLSSRDNLAPSLIGHWLLIIFSEYLQLCNGFGNDFEILAFCLKQFGWRDEDTRLLIEGLPTSILLNPDSKSQPNSLSFADPYWFWMRPYQSKGGGGWLGKQSIHYLRDKLEMSRPLINTLNPSVFGRKMGNLVIDIPDGQVDYLYRSHRIFNSAFDMLDKAIREDKEIFMLTAYS